MDLFDKLQSVVNDAREDAVKFSEGNNAAGTRLRKALQVAKSLAQDLRTQVTSIKDARSGKGEDTIRKYSEHAGM